MANTPTSAIRSTVRWTFSGQRSVALVAVLIVGVDIALGLVHLLVMALFDAPNLWRVDMDGSYGEAFQYVKYVWVLALVIVYARQARNWPMVAWVPLIVYFLLDDSVQFHELIGYWYSTQPWSFGISVVSAETLGELAASAAFGLVLLIPLVIGYLKGDARTRWIFRVMAVILAVLLVFAVVIDVLHSLVVDIRILDRGIGFAEDFGEMLALSALVLFVFRLNVSGGERGFATPPAGVASGVAERSAADSNPAVVARSRHAS
ncbi:hypothetical protein [Herbiconiux daphne]|uniref:VanZ-like domain-containing protein n=1 Tax=Herbiconiux daphne TaxID=2970914 RepID=A0ABT2H6W1_9MICO|nr:hypothetical protein [Herbiconiux daphne]MCS5735648.1 hypothetical protein [Herbiconiux daphne]